MDNRPDLIQGIPAWNFELLVNIFENDNYWDTSLQEDDPEAFEAITSIGKKYGDIADYEEALEVYNKYEPRIIEYYGGKKAVDFIIDEFDTIPVGIIKPPKLKNKLKAKYVEGINYSTGKYYDPVTPEEQLLWDQGRFDDDGNPEGTEIPDITRSLKRALRATILKKPTKASQVFFKTDIISQIQNGNLNSEEEEIMKSEHMSLAEHIALYEKRHEPQYEKLTQQEIRAILSGTKCEEENKNRYSLVKDAAITPDILIKKLMINSGLNPISPEKRDNMSAAELNRLASYLGPQYVYDDKALKKLAKKSDKLMRKAKEKYDRKAKRHIAEADRALADLLTHTSRVSRNGWED